jgi:hypothetical protein
VRKRDCTDEPVDLSWLAKRALALMDALRYIEKYDRLSG